MEPLADVGATVRIAAVPAAGDSSPWNDRLIAHFTRLGTSPSGAERLVESSDAVLASLRQAIKNGRWAPALELIRVAEPAFMLAGRWGAWASILKMGLTAARNLGDRRAEGWVLHEQGVRAMALGHFDEAYERLTQALVIRLDAGAAEDVERTRSQLVGLMAQRAAAG